MKKIATFLRRRAFEAACAALKLKHTAHTCSMQANRRCGNARVGLTVDAQTYSNWRITLASTEARNKEGRLEKIHPEDNRRKVVVLVNSHGVHFIV